MRVVVFADAEGVAGIGSHRELCPAFTEYWETGRDATTDDVVAAAQGLLAGGASAVTVFDGHGPGSWRTVVADRLPVGVDLLESPLRPGDYDAAFHVGFHARCGTPHGFLSHTHVPDAFRMKVNGALITENHSAAWSAGVPVLGVTGDEPLQGQLDGVLAGTPFLAVKHSTGREATQPVHSDPAVSAAAIRDFARDCVRHANDRSVPRLPEGSTVAISMSPALADRAEGQAGLRRASAAVLVVKGGSWPRDIRPALGVAAAVAMGPVDAPLAELDISSADRLGQQDANRLQQVRDDISARVLTLHAEWAD
jgi:D-amino peptidase